MSYQTPHRRYLDLVRGVTGIRGKRVLEVGGSTPPRIVLPYAPAEWLSVNLDTPSVEQFNDEARELGVSGYAAVCEDVTTYARSEYYDLIYSINAFEHIHDLDVAFAQMLRALKNDGYLFTLFGPIWSSDVGHHLSVCTDDNKVLHFLDGLLSPWEHLTSTRAAIHAKLAALYGETAARRAVTYIYDYPDLNRLYESDYLKIVRECGFSPVLIVRNRKGRAPNVPGATNTREILMVLKKGRVTPLDKFLCLARFAVAFGTHHVRSRLRVSRTV